MGDANVEFKVMGEGDVVDVDSFERVTVDAELKPDEIERKLRTCSPPVISRIADNLVLLDLRTVDAREEPELLAALRSLNS